MFQLKTNVSCVKTQEVVKNLFLFDRGSNYLENTWSTDKSWWKMEHLLLQSTVTHSVTTNANFSSDHDQEDDDDDDDDDWEQIMVSVNTVLIDQVTMKNKQKYVRSGLQSNNDIWDHFLICRQDEGESEQE